MKLKSMFVLSSFALSLGSALAAPKPAPLQPAPGKVTIQGLKVTYAGRDIFRGGKRVSRKGDAVIEGTIKNPAQLKSTTLSVSALKILYSQANSAIYASKEAGQTIQVTLSGAFSARSNKNSIRIEATCDTAKFIKGVWTLEGNVSGFHEDSNGRMPLRGDIVKLSAFDNAISVVQDGVISLLNDSN